MEITFSAHAIHRMDERSITEEEIRMVLGSPQREANQGDNDVAMGLRANGHLLIVVYRKMENQYHIITVIDTSKVDKYL